MPPPPDQVPAIVVGVQDYADADRIVRLLTPTHGRVSALARRARSSQRRFGGALDLGNRVEAAIRPGQGSLWHLQEATLVDGRLHARRDLALLGLLVYSVELCGALSREHHPEPRLFGLLDTTGLLLGAMTAAPGRLFRLGLEAKALTFAGFQPVLDRCARCDGPLEDPMCFVAESGGAEHVRCHIGVAPPVPLGWLQAVEQARRTPLRELIDLAAPPGPDDALALCVEAHLGAPLKARRMLTAMAPDSPPRLD